MRGAEMLCLVANDAIQPQPRNALICEKSGTWHNKVHTCMHKCTRNVQRMLCRSIKRVVYTLTHIPGKRQNKPIEKKKQSISLTGSWEATWALVHIHKRIRSAPHTHTSAHRQGWQSGLGPSWQTGLSFEEVSKGIMRRRSSWERRSGSGSREQEKNGKQANWGERVCEKTWFTWTMTQILRGISLEKEPGMELSEIKRRGEMRRVGKDQVGKETTIDRLKKRCLSKTLPHWYTHLRVLHIQLNALTHCCATKVIYWHNEESGIEN